MRMEKERWEKSFSLGLLRNFRTSSRRHTFHSRSPIAFRATVLGEGPALSAVAVVVAMANGDAGEGLDVAARARRRSPCA